MLSLKQTFLPAFIAGLSFCCLHGEGEAAEWLPHFWRRSPPPTHSERIDRAGQPLCVSPWAKCSADKYDDGYYVGGGAALTRDSDTRYWREGTWGYDYTFPFTRTNLRWYHGRRDQGGEGQYEPDEKNRPLAPLLSREE